MPAISRTWRSTHSMPAAWSPLRRAGAPAGDRRTEVLRSIRIIFPQGKLQRVHIFSSRPFRRWPCLTRNDREAEAAADQVEVVAAAVPVVAAQDGGEKLVAAEARAVRYGAGQAGRAKGGTV